MSHSPPAELGISIDPHLVLAHYRVLIGHGVHDGYPAVTMRALGLLVAVHTWSELRVSDFAVISGVSRHSARRWSRILQAAGVVSIARVPRPYLTMTPVISLHGSESVTIDQGLLQMLFGAIPPDSIATWIIALGISSPDGYLPSMLELGRVTRLHPSRSLIRFRDEWQEYGLVTSDGRLASFVTAPTLDRIRDL